MKKSLIAYVDGFNLYNGMHDAFGHQFLWLDLVKLMESYRPDHTIVKVYYFTAPLLDDPGAQSRQAIYWNALEEINGDRISIVKGRYQRKTVTCKACGEDWASYEEKETDVNLAMAIVRDAAIQRATDYYLLSGDSDASPAIREAMAVNPTGFYKAFFPPRRTSYELQSLMPRSEVIGRSRLSQSQLPARVQSPEGAVYEQPGKWKPASFETTTPPVSTSASGASAPTPLEVMGKHACK